MKRVKKGFLNNESGAVAVYVAIGVVVLVGAAALALDIAHLVSVKRELTKAAEAGALSGARALWPQALSTVSGRDPDCTHAADVALTTTTKNRVDAPISPPVRSRWRWAGGITSPNSLPRE